MAPLESRAKLAQLHMRIAGFAASLVELWTAAAAITGDFEGRRCAFVAAVLHSQAILEEPSSRHNRPIFCAAPCRALWLIGAVKPPSQPSPQTEDGACTLEGIVEEGLISR